MYHNVMYVIEQKTHTSITVDTQYKKQFKNKKNKKIHYFMQKVLTYYAVVEEKKERVHPFTQTYSIY